MIHVVAAYIQKDGRFLVGQRPSHKARGGLWEFVGGKTEPGETPEQALIRECREELGVTVLVLEPFAELTHIYPDLTVLLTVFRAEIVSGEPKKLEHQSLQWISPEEIPEYAFCPADVDILEKIRREDSAAKLTVSAEIRRKLWEMHDEAYGAFNRPLLPNVPGDRVLGVRIPWLRRYAKALFKDAAKREAFMNATPHAYHEENLLHGFLIERIGCFDDAVAALQRFLPYVDNWAVCDCMSPKVLADHPDRLLGEIRGWLTADSPYTVRYAIGMLMRYYLEDAFAVEYLAMVAAVKQTDYYVRMMVAWYFATALAKQYQATLPYLTENKLDVWTHNKIIQKAIESRRVPNETKQLLRGLKRQNRTGKE